MDICLPALHYGIFLKLRASLFQLIDHFTAGFTTLLLLFHRLEHRLVDRKYPAAILLVIEPLGDGVA
ncbi:hypothetical protein ACU8V3_12650 [Cobetia marina]